jgi:hypothetical protein
MTSGSGSGAGFGVASVGISATGAAENSERNPRRFIPGISGGRDGSGMGGTGYLFLPPVNGNSTVVPERHQVGRHRDLETAESAEAVEQCGFPGTVWSYQAQNCSRIHIEAYAVERNDTPELNANVVDFQNLGLQDGLSTFAIVNGRNAGQTCELLA